MNLEYILTSLEIRKFYRYSSVKSSRSEQCRIKRIRSVGCCKNDDTIVAFESIHLGEELVKCLLTLIIAAYLPVSPLTYGIYLIDEHYTWSLFLCLLEQIPYL